MRKLNVYMNIPLSMYCLFAVPNVYPVDLFERLWMVDRLERLGVDRHFEREIKECLDYVYKSVWPWAFFRIL